MNTKASSVLNQTARTVVIISLNSKNIKTNPTYTSDFKLSRSHPLQVVPYSKQTFKFKQRSLHNQTIHINYNQRNQTTNRDYYHTIYVIIINSNIQNKILPYKLTHVTNPIINLYTSQTFIYSFQSLHHNHIESQQQVKHLLNSSN